MLTVLSQYQYQGISLKYDFVSCHQMSDSGKSNIVFTKPVQHLLLEIRDEYTEWA